MNEAKHVSEGHDVRKFSVAGESNKSNLTGRGTLKIHLTSSFSGSLSHIRQREREAEREREEDDDKGRSLEVRTKVSPRKGLWASYTDRIKVQCTTIRYAWI